MKSQSKAKPRIDKLEWKPSYSVGYRAMDNQHRMLFDVINRLGVSQNTPTTDSNLREIFDELHTYSEAHFRAEEKLMELMGYGKISSHREEHSRYLEQLKDLEERFEGGHDRIDLELLRFLSKWWSTHVLDEDQGYARKA